MSGAKELLSEPRRALWWLPGTGKTRTAIMALDELAKSRKPFRALVICPSTVRLVWEQEIAKWSTAHPKLPVMLPRKNTEFPQLGHGVMVLSYDRISNSEQTILWLTRGRWTVLILDEAHFLKDSSSNRSKRIYRKIVPACDRVWCLTGTPALNHAGDLYPHFAGLWPQIIPGEPGKPMSRMEFENRFCNVRMQRLGGREIRVVSGSNPSNADFLKRALLQVGSRYRLEDVEKDMPGLTFTTTPLDVPSSGWIDEALDDEDFMAKLRADEVAFATQRRLTGLSKIEAVAKYLDEQLDGTEEKIIVFAWHPAVLSALKDKLAGYKPVVVSGETSFSDREANVKTFRADRWSRVFLGQIKSCGTGLTLIEANRVFFVESSFTPDDNFQAACRAWRIGQKHPVIATHFTAPGIDARVHAILSRKENELASLLT